MRARERRMLLDGSERATVQSLPFYASRSGTPDGWTLDDLEDFAAANDDPFGGRVAAGTKPPVALQIEATSEPPVWIALDRGELDAWAAGLARTWKRLGLRARDVIAFFDYGSNPCVLLSSAIYVSHLDRGAVDRVGAVAICNDGVASMTGRMLGILGAVKPAALVVRRDLVAPLVDALATAGLPPDGRLRFAAVIDVDGAPKPADAERLARSLGVPVRRFLRADEAFLLAADCESCGAFHLEKSIYAARALAPGGVAVTARFARLCPSVDYRIDGRLAPGRCDAEPHAQRIVLV